MKEKISKNPIMRGVALMLLSSLSTCLGQMMWKLSTSGAILPLLCGFALYAVGAVLMVTALRYGELSVLHPILGAGYVLSLFIGSAVFREMLSVSKVLGVLVIIAGLVLIVRGEVKK